MIFKKLIKNNILELVKPITQLARKDIVETICCFLLLLILSYVVVNHPIVDKKLENHPLAFYVFGGEYTKLFNYWYQFVKLILYSFLFVGVAYTEEIIFRGPILLIVKAKGNEKIKKWLIIIFSVILSLLFMISHFKATIALYILTFIWGCFLSWVVVQTKTLKWAIIAHAIERCYSYLLFPALITNF